MLQSLQIKNLALVESIGIDFAPGLNVLTGETGAGKSIIVGALNLLLGERADRDMIREGESTCSIDAVFKLADTATIDNLLAGSGLPPCQDGALVLRRIVSASGGRQFVNDNPAALQTMKAIGELLVDLHGPHEHQSLLKNAFQLELLDVFARVGEHMDKYRDEFDRRAGLMARLEALRAEGGGAAEADTLAFHVRELEQAALGENEERGLLDEHRTLANAERVIQLAAAIQQALMEGEQNAFDRLASARQAAGELERLAPAAAGWKDEIKSAADAIQDLARTVAAFSAKIGGDSSRLGKIEERLALYHRLKAKHNCTAAELKEKLRLFKERLANLLNRGERLAQLETELAESTERLGKLAGLLSEKRSQSAATMARSVLRHLRDLGLGNASFEVRLDKIDFTRSGADQAEFVFSANKGERGKPLRAIASSGEISRVMLALKTVLADHDRIPVLVFDEIDENIGGQTATVVGRKLAELSARRQVICITHLPQVAVFGDTQFAVRKEIRGGRTVSRVFALDSAGRVDEIARMLGGADLTSVTLKHARELLEKTKTFLAKTQRTLR